MPVDPNCWNVRNWTACERQGRSRRAGLLELLLDERLQLRLAELTQWRAVDDVSTCGPVSMRSAFGCVERRKQLSVRFLGSGRSVGRAIDAGTDAAEANHGTNPSQQ